MTTNGTNGKVKEFTPLFDKVVKELGLYPAIVYGQVWRHCKMSEKVCFASREAMADLCGLSRKTFNRYLPLLIEKEYIIDRSDGLKNHPHTYLITDKINNGIEDSTGTGSPSKNDGEDSTGTGSPLVGLGVPPTGTGSPTHWDWESQEDTYNIGNNNNNQSVVVVENPSLTQETPLQSSVDVGCKAEEPSIEERARETALQSTVDAGSSTPVKSEQQVANHSAIDLLRGYPGFCLDDGLIEKASAHDVETMKAIIAYAEKHSTDNVCGFLRRLVDAGFQPPIEKAKAEKVEKTQGLTFIETYALKNDISVEYAQDLYNNATYEFNRYPPIESDIDVILERERLSA